MPLLLYPGRSTTLIVAIMKFPHPCPPACVPRSTQRFRSRSCSPFSQPSETATLGSRSRWLVTTDKLLSTVLNPTLVNRRRTCVLRTAGSTAGPSLEASGPLARKLLHPYGS